MVVGLWKGEFWDDLKMVLSILFDQRERIVLAFSDLSHIFEDTLSGKFKLPDQMIDKFHDYLSYIDRPNW